MMCVCVNLGHINFFPFIVKMFVLSRGVLFDMLAVSIDLLNKYYKDK